jgi:3-phosphoinositide dependent protein kinase-1
MASLAQARDFAVSHGGVGVGGGMGMNSSVMLNSYSGESALTLNELSSTISSPSSTLGLGEQIEGVNVPFGGGGGGVGGVAGGVPGSRHLRRKAGRDKEGGGFEGDDGESVRSFKKEGSSGGGGFGGARKRFSRRHSKNGLAAVF